MKEPVDPIAFGRRIHERRTELGMSQTDLAVAAGYSQSRIGSFELGEVKRPERAAGALAVALQTSTDWLLFRRGPKQVGPRFLHPTNLVKKYEVLSPDEKALITQYLEDAERRRDSQQVS